MERSAFKSFPLFLKNNRLSLNNSKTYFVKFKAYCKKKGFNLWINKNVWVKLLGLHRDYRLNFQYHVSTRCNRISKLLRFLSFPNKIHINPRDFSTFIATLSR